MKATAVLVVFLALFAVASVRAEEEVDSAVVDVYADYEAFDSLLEVGAADEQEEEDSDESEDESEEEAEEEEESEATESEEDSEADSLAETAADTETDAQSNAEFEAAFAAAIGENAQGKWHVYSNMITETAHEGITLTAFNSGVAKTHQQYFNPEKLRTGVIWNDMPVGVDGEEAKAVRDGHMDVDTWTRLFFATGGVNDLVFNVHYGCLQHWHSMAPIQRREAKNAAATRIVFTNQQVRTYIIAQIQKWWKKAVARKADPATSSWYLGHILHTIQDSYPRGHTVRSSDAGGCGGILSFQGYDAQHGNSKHKSGDYTPANRNKEANPTLMARYTCAVQASASVLKAFGHCNAGTGPCDAKALTEILNTVYTLAPGAASSLAGGSAEEFAKAGIATDTANYVKSVMAGGITLYNPKSSKLAGTQNVLLCDGDGPIQSKTPSGFGFYRSGPYTTFYNPKI